MMKSQEKDDIARVRYRLRVRNDSGLRLLTFH
jgi:hypothetical protein